MHSIGFKIQDIINAIGNFNKFSKTNYSLFKKNNASQILIYPEQKIVQI